MIYVICVLCIFIILEIFMLFVIYLILKILRRNIHAYTAQTLKLHRQFSLLLGAQFLSPLIYVFAPVVAAVIAMLVGVKPNKLVVQISIFGIIFYGCTNSILSVGFVTPFRKHFLYVISFSWLKSLLKTVRFPGCCVSSAVQDMPTMVNTPNHRV